MAHDVLMLTVRMVHIVAGVLWIGGLTFAGLIVARSLMGAPPQVRGPAMGLIGPRGLRFGMWAGAVTIVFGAALQIMMHMDDMIPRTAWGPMWNALIGTAFLIGVVMLGLAGAVVKPTMRKMAAATTPEQAAPLAKRMMMLSMTSIVLGVSSIILMVWATSLRTA